MYDLSVESRDYLWLVTTRTINQRLWFINNPKLEYYILAFLAKYAKMYGVELYGFCIMGNHYHLLARFIRNNRAGFLRAFNSIIAKLVATHVKGYPGGKLWGRRARVQAVPLTKCSISTLLYLALNPVSSGLVKNAEDYPSYNSFRYAVDGVVRKYKLLNKTMYYKKLQYDLTAKKADFIETHELSFSKLPVYVELSCIEYKQRLLKAYDCKHKELLSNRKREGKKFPLLESILSTKIGSSPYQSKISERDTKRPLILTKCMETKNLFFKWYFSIVDEFRKASKKLLQGFSAVIFPSGTYRPVSYST